MANNYQQATTAPPLPLTERHDLILKAAGLGSEEEIRALGLDDEALAFCLELTEDDDAALVGVDWWKDGDGTTFIIGESGNLERLAQLLQMILLDLPADEHPFVTIEWAETCSKMRVGEFGGGACFITRDDVRWFSTGEWLRRQVKALQGEIPEPGDFPGIVATDLAPHVRRLLDRIADGVRKAVPDCDVSDCGAIADMDDDGEPTWLVGFEHGGNVVDLTFTVTSEEARDGSDGHGVGLLMGAVRDGGEVVADWAPYNFTDKLWVQPDGPASLAEMRRRLGVDGGGLETLADEFGAAIAEALGAEGDA